MTALDKAKQKLEANLGAKAYYEAQQQVLTVYRRLRSKGSKLEAHELLTFAINRMFVAAQVISTPKYDFLSTMWSEECCMPSNLLLILQNTEQYCIICRVLSAMCD